MQKTKNGFRFEFELFLWHTRTHTLCRLYDFYHCKTRMSKQQCMILISKGHNVHMLKDSKILHKTCINILQNKNCDIKRAQNMHIPLKTWFCYEMCKKKHAHTPKKEICFEIRCEENMHIMDSKSIILNSMPPNHIYRFQSHLCSAFWVHVFCIILRTLDNKHWKYSFWVNPWWWLFFGIYAALLRLKCIKPPYAQITMFAKENQLYWYTNPTRMFESMAASCHLTFITCLLLFNNCITVANFLTIRIFHCKSPHSTEKVGCGGWA